MRNKVLIFFADAPPSVREMLSRALASENLDARWAANCRQVIDLLRDQPPDLLLLDFNRSLKRATYFLEQLRIVNPFVPLILITDHKTKFERVLAKRVTALIGEPFEVSLLLRTIGEVLKSVSRTPKLDTQSRPLVSPVHD